MVGFSECQRVVIEVCKVQFADFSGVGLYKGQDCTLRRCDLSYNGCTGLGLALTENCVVEDCTLLFNNYRRFSVDWGVAAGMKNIPGNRRTTVRRCEAAYNREGQVIWFDTGNEDIRILENIAHHNGDGVLFPAGQSTGNLQTGISLATDGSGEARVVYRAGTTRDLLVKVQCEPYTTDAASTGIGSALNIAQPDAGIYSATRLANLNLRSRPPTSTPTPEAR